MSDIIIIHGYTGAGKTACSKRLAKLSPGSKPIEHLSIGDHLRDIRTGVVSSKFAHIINNHNTLLPPDPSLINNLIFDLISPEDNSITLLDGYPRYKDTIDIFLKAIKDHQHRLLGCLSLDLSFNTCVSRQINRGVRHGENIDFIDHESFAKERYDRHAKITLDAIDELSKTTPTIHLDAETDLDTLSQEFNIVVGRLALSASNNSSSNKS